MKPYIKIYEGDNIQYLPLIKSQSVDLCYIDPPFNSGKTQMLGDLKYDDTWKSIEEYISDLRDRILQIHPILKPNGNLCVHIDYRMSHHVRLMIEKQLLCECKNEIIWAYDFGGRSKRKFPTKHDTILWFSLGDNYTFNRDACDKIPYMAPGLVGKEKAERGKYPTDVWWHTIVGTQAKERTGYPTQKPLGIINRLVQVLSNPGDLLLDCFCGSGTFGVSAIMHKRSVILMDENPDAIKVVNKRLDLLKNEGHQFKKEYINNETSYL